jgi:PBSX family phage portal protein
MTKFEADDDRDDISDGFHYDDPDSENYGSVRELDVDLLDSRENYLYQELKKLQKGDDRFTAVPTSVLNKNEKRRVSRLNKRLQGEGGAKAKFIEPDAVNGYDFYRLAVPPYNLDYLCELSTENATHAACIRAKTVNIVGLGYKWEETNKVKDLRMSASEDDSKMQFLARKLQRVTDKLDDWLDNLNEEDDIIDILTKIWLDVEATGNGYLEIGRNRNGSIGYIGHVPAATIRVRVDRDGFMQWVLPNNLNSSFVNYSSGPYPGLVFFRNFGDTTTKDPTGKDSSPNELIHFKKHSPRNSYYGIPDIIAALSAVAGEKFAAEYNLDYFENKAVPRYALIIKGAKLTAQAERKIMDFFRKEVKGKHHSTLYIPVPAPMGSNVDVQLQAIENKIQDASFSKYRQDNKQEIRMVHHVPASKLADETANNASARESDKTFKNQVCAPEQRRIEKKFSKIIKEVTDMFDFKLESYDLVDEETQSRIDDRYFRMGASNPNEIRAKRGHQPREGGDKYYDPSVKPVTDAADPALEVMRQKAAASPTGAKKGPPQKTADGGKNNKNVVRTPASQTPTGAKPKNAAVDQSGARASRR